MDIVSDVEDDAARQVASAAAVSFQGEPVLVLTVPFSVPTQCYTLSVPTHASTPSVFLQ